MDLAAEFRQRRAELEESIAQRFRRTVEPDPRTPLEKLAAAVDRPAGPGSSNPKFNEALRRLAGDDE